MSKKASNPPPPIGMKRPAPPPAPPPKRNTQSREELQSWYENGLNVQLSCQGKLIIIPPIRIKL